MLTLSNLPILPIAIDDLTPTTILVSGDYSFRVDGGPWSAVISQSIPIVILIPGGDHTLDVTDNFVTTSVILTRTQLPPTTLEIFADSGCTNPLTDLFIPGSMFLKVTGTEKSFRNVNFLCSDLLFSPATISELPAGVTEVIVTRISVPVVASATTYTIKFHCEEWWPDNMKSIIIPQSIISATFGDPVIFDIYGDTGGVVVINNQLYTVPCTVVLDQLAIGDHSIPIWSNSNLNITTITVHILNKPAPVAIPPDSTGYSNIISIVDMNIIGNTFSVDVNDITVYPPCALPEFSPKLYNYPRNIHAVLSNVVGDGVLGIASADVVYPISTPKIYLGEYYGLVDNLIDPTTCGLYLTSDEFKTWDKLADIAKTSILLPFNDFWFTIDHLTEQISINYTYDFIAWDQAPMTFGPTGKLFNLGTHLIALEVGETLGDSKTWLTTDAINWVMTVIPAMTVLDMLYTGQHYLALGYDNIGAVIRLSSTDNGPTLVTRASSLTTANTAYTNVILYSGALFALHVNTTASGLGSIISITRSGDDGLTWVSVLTPGLSKVLNSSGKALFSTASSIFYCTGDSIVYDILLGVHSSLSTVYPIESTSNYLVGQDALTGQIFTLTDVKVGWVASRQPLSILSSGTIDGVATSVDVNGITVYPPCAVPPLTDSLYNFPFTVQGILTNVVNGTIEVETAVVDFPLNAPNNFCMSGYSNLPSPSDGTKNKLYKTVDNYRSWQLISSDIPSSTDFTIFKDSFLVTTITETTVSYFTSTDQDNWTLIIQVPWTSTGQFSVCIAGDYAVLIAGNLLYKSTDGTIFTQFTTAVPQLPNAVTRPSSIVKVIYTGTYYIAVGSMYFLNRWTGDTEQALGISIGTSIDNMVPGGYGTTPTYSWTAVLPVVTNIVQFGTDLYATVNTDQASSGILKSTDGGFHWAEVFSSYTSGGSLFTTTTAVFYVLTSGLTYNLLDSTSLFHGFQLQGNATDATDITSYIGKSMPHTSVIVKAATDSHLVGLGDFSNSSGRVYLLQDLITGWIPAVDTESLSIVGTTITGWAKSVKANTTVVYPPCSLPLPNSDLSNSATIAYMVLSELETVPEVTVTIAASAIDVLFPAKTPTYLGLYFGYTGELLPGSTSIRDFKLYKTSDYYKTWQLVTEHLSGVTTADVVGQLTRFNDQYVAICKTLVGYYAVMTSIDCGVWQEVLQGVSVTTRLRVIGDTLLVIGLTIPRDTNYTSSMGLPIVTYTKDFVTWTTFSSRFDLLIQDAIFTGETFIYVGTSCTDNSGQTLWSPIRVCLSPGDITTVPHYVTSSVFGQLTLQPVVDNLVMLGTDVYARLTISGEDQVIKSSDYGVTWSRVELQGGNFNIVLYVTPSTVWYTGDNRPVTDLISGKLVISTITVIGTDELNLLGKDTEGRIWFLSDADTGWVLAG